MDFRRKALHFSTNQPVSNGSGGVAVVANSVSKPNATQSVPNEPKPQVIQPSNTVDSDQKPIEPAQPAQPVANEESKAEFIPAPDPVEEAPKPNIKTATQTVAEQTVIQPVPQPAIRTEKEAETEPIAPKSPVVATPQTQTSDVFSFQKRNIYIFAAVASLLFIASILWQQASISSLKTERNELYNQLREADPIRVGGQQ